MHYKNNEIWEYLRQNEVKKVRLKDDDFEFLMTNGQAVRPHALFKYLNHKIEKQRPKKIVKGVFPSIRRSISRSDWMSDFDSLTPRVRMEKVMGFQNEEDEKKNSECDRRAQELTQKAKDLKELYNLVRFGEAEIPSDLSVYFEEHDTKRSDRSQLSLQKMPKGRQQAQMKEVSLDWAKKKIVEEFTSETFDGNRIDLCRELLERYNIKGRPNYSADQLNNTVAQYLNKLKNKDKPKK